MQNSFIYSAPFGNISVLCDEDAVWGIEFLPQAIPVASPKNSLERELVRQLSAYFHDAKFRFDVPLKLEGTPHQRKVWDAMRDIPCGEVKTYGDLARSLHSSPRAVGQACGNNPIPVIVPCHRVVSKAGLGGFMHRADQPALDIKRWLLAHEAKSGNRIVL